MLEDKSLKRFLIYYYIACFPIVVFLCFFFSFPLLPTLIAYGISVSSSICLLSIKSTFIVKKRIGKKQHEVE